MVPVNILWRQRRNVDSGRDEALPHGALPLQWIARLKLRFLGNLDEAFADQVQAPHARHHIEVFFQHVALVKVLFLFQNVASRLYFL